MSRSRSNLPDEPLPWARRLGGLMRAARSARGLTLATVAQETGVSASFLSLLEQGRTDVSLGRLLPLLEFYKISGSDVLDPAESESDLVRSGEAPLLFSMAEGIDVYLAAPDRKRSFLPLIVDYASGAEMQRWSSHGGEEFLFVLRGKVHIRFRDGSTVELGAGDSYFFSSDRAHRVSAAGRTSARALVVTTGELPS